MTSKNKPRRGAGSAVDPTEPMRVLFREIFFKARAISRRRLGHFGLTPTQFMALGALMRNDGAAVGEMAEEIGVSPSTMSRILDQLEKRQYLRRAISRGDRRRIRVFLRPKGKKLRDKVRTFWSGLGREMFRNFTQHDREVLQKRLDLIYENLMRVERTELET